jgi:hypothetical protein
MANETNNSGQVTDNGNNNSGNANSADDRGGTVDGVDPTISKHLDMAIEAQDGPKDANAKEANSDEGTDKTKQQASGESSTGDSSAQSGDKSKDPAITEAARTLAGAKDLKLQDGTVVKGGAERRFFEQREIARSQLAEVQKDFGNLQNEHKALQDKFTALENSTKQLHGVDAKTLSVGAKIVGDLQRDPVGALKKLLAEVAAQGYNVEDLGVGVDTAAITRLLEERLPQQKTEKTDVELEQEATAEVTQFYSAFPDARPHDKLLAAVLRDHPELDLRSAYYAVKSGFADKGYDWSLSLEDNLKATASGDGNNQSDGNNNNPNQQKPLPNGGNAANAEFKLNDTAVADDNMDTGDIVKQAMREAGMNI